MPLVFKALELVVVSLNSEISPVVIWHGHLHVCVWHHGERLLSYLFGFCDVSGEGEHRWSPG